MRFRRWPGARSSGSATVILQMLSRGTFTIPFRRLPGLPPFLGAGEASGRRGSRCGGRRVRRSGRKWAGDRARASEVGKGGQYGGVN
ncbi:hypothetical protein NL676_034132 [Syzygium grande]|nr:hypothetical protein NL676_034132 [Syzygium grande]